MRKLGLDLGTKSCGFAITDQSEILATGLENFTFPENNFELVLNRISELLREYKNQIDGFVLGYPLKISGEKSDRTLMVEAFKTNLEHTFGLPVILINEQYTTKQAKAVLKAAGLTSQKQKKHKDKLAAQLILNDYLEYYLIKKGA